MKREISLVLGSIILSACGGGGLFDPCDEDSECGYPETVFQCIEGQCTRGCTVETDDDGLVGACVQSSVCTSMAELAGEEVCCNVEVVRRGPGVLGDYLAEGTCLAIGAGLDVDAQPGAGEPPNSDVRSCVYEVEHIIRCSDGTVDQGTWAETCTRGACPDGGARHECNGGCCVTTLTRNHQPIDRACP